MPESKKSQTELTNAEIDAAYGSAKQLGGGDYDLERKAWLWAYHAEVTLKKRAEALGKALTDLRDKHLLRDSSGELIYVADEKGKPDKDRPRIADQLAFQKEQRELLESKQKVPLQPIKASTIGDLLYDAPTSLWVNLGPLFDMDIDSEQE